MGELKKTENDPVNTEDSSGNVDPFSMNLMDPNHNEINSLETGLGPKNEKVESIIPYPIPSMINKGRVLKSINDIIKSNDIEKYNNYLKALEKFIVERM